jgi:hypothetical protein
MLDEINADEANSCMAEVNEYISENIKQTVKARRSSSSIPTWTKIEAREDYRVPVAYK